jgi:branched-chain amino acid transport system permease protein
VLISFYYRVAYPTMGFIATFRAFIICVVGGMGSIPGAVLAGFSFGLIDSFSITILPSGFSDSIPFLILIAFLLFKPAGIFGKIGEEAGEGQESNLVLKEGKLSLKRLPFRGWPLIGIILVFALLLPYITSSYYVLRLAFLVGLYGILALGLNFVLGYTGQLSMCHATFYAIGAYTTALLSLRLNAPFTVTLLASCLAGFISGICVGLPGLRLRGYYLALVTLGFGALVKVILVHWYDFTGGPNGLRGIPPPIIFSYKISSQEQFYLLVLFFLLVTCFISYILDRSSMVAP